MISIKRRIQRLTNARKAKHKGHELIQKHETLISSMLNAQSIIIEIGSDREAGSTKVLAQLAKNNDAHFITVDVDEQATERAQSIIDKIDPSFQAINDYGEKYLAGFNKPVQLIYLDAFDLPGDWHSPEVIDSYHHRKTELTLENCHKMHLDCVREIHTNMPAGSFVCFDDVNPVGPSGNMLFEKVSSSHMLWSGKGKTAIPFLVENGFHIIDNIRASVLLRKNH
jgi:hypothetical protein